MRPTEIDHRLDRKQHAGLKRHAFARATIMQDVGLVMEEAAKPMATKIPHHGAALRFSEALNGVTDIAGCRAWTDRSDAAHQAFIGHFDEALGAARHITNEIHAA